tara:strand:+ start:2810 stop:3310 length:501 start_codon:yes stop_codon:yes gene_type:complete
MTNVSKIAAAAGLSLIAMSFSAPVSAQEDSAESMFAVQSAASGRVNAGAGAFERGEFDVAERFGRASLERPARLSRPRRSIAYANWCAALSMVEQHDEAIAACEEAIALRPDNWRAHLNLASAQMRAGDTAQAESALAEATRLAPGEPVVSRAAALISSRSPVSGQ